MRRLSAWPGRARGQVPILVVRERAGQTTDTVLEVADKASASDQPVNVQSGARRSQPHLFAD